LKFIDIFKISSSWQPIKMAWTKSIIALGKLGEDTLIDAVPLDEVSEIHNMQEGASSISASANPIEKGSSTLDLSNLENSQNKSKRSLTNQASSWMPRKNRKGLDSTKNLSAIQSNDGPPALIGKGLTAAVPVMLIMTDDHGYNSGRKYYFQAKSDADRREIVDTLSARSKAARTSKEAKGKVQKIRERVSAFTKSDIFQYFFAFLIAMVKPRHIAFYFFG
jgi:hypothetical protein